MVLKPKTRAVKFTHGTQTVVIRPHQTIRLPAGVGKRLLGQAPDKIKRVTPKR